MGLVKHYLVIFQNGKNTCSLCEALILPLHETWPSVMSTLLTLRPGTPALMLAVGSFPFKVRKAGNSCGSLDASVGLRWAVCKDEALLL